MGLLDAFGREDRVEVTFTDFYNLMRESAKAELMENALRRNVPACFILDMLDKKEPDLVDEAGPDSVDEEDPNPVDEDEPAEDGEMDPDQVGEEEPTEATVDSGAMEKAVTNFFSPDSETEEG